MKKFLQICIAFIFLLLCKAAQSQETGVICYQQKITLSFKNSENKAQENDSSVLKSLLLVMAEGKEVSLYHKVIFSGSLSKKYGVDEINISPKNNYSSDSYLTLRNSIKKTENNFDIEDKKIIPTATKKIGELNFKYTGITKKIMGFSCREIIYEVREGNKKIEGKALIAADLPASAGFELYANVPGAIIQMEVKNRILTIAKMENLTAVLPLSFFKP